MHMHTYLITFKIPKAAQVAHLLMHPAEVAGICFCVMLQNMADTRRL